MTRRLLAVAAALILAAPAAAAPKELPDKRPQVEVVFCLDTTGSMGGLIEGAKQKIWSISNQIVAGKPTPNLKVGLVAYRDRDDAYVTKIDEPDRRPRQDLRRPSRSSRPTAAGTRRRA